MRRRSQLVAALALLLAAANAPTGAASQPGGFRGDEVVRAPVDAAERQVRRYWTQERMREAEPIELRRAGGRASSAGSSGRTPRSHAAVNRFEVTDTTSYPARVHGKVFLTFPGAGDFVCSGTVIGSGAGNVVFTTGHCVFDAGPESQGFTNEWATNWMFVPGYRDGQAPFGEWVASGLASTTAWVQEADIRYDIGAAVMEPRQGSELEPAVGARGIAFDQPREQSFRALGYPAMQPPLEFTGERLFACDSPYGGDDTTVPPPRPMLIACDMTQGSSGGGWVIEDTYVNSVISYGYLLEPNDLYGPYFGPEAAAVYQRAAGAAHCFGQEPTLIGTLAGETLRGSARPDVILALGGDDTLRPGAGKDLVCAGPGADSVLGGPGGDRLGGQGDADTLRGQGGRDTLNGGAEGDLCDGGPGRDTARRCEERRRLR